jgi:molecular chaperone GrpE
MTEIRVHFSSDSGGRGGGDSLRGDGSSAPSSGAGAPAEGTAAPRPAQGDPTPGSSAAQASTGAPSSHGTPGAGEAGGTIANGQQPDNEAKDVQGDLDELLKTARQRDEYLALAQRTQADFENYRKRVAKEAAAAQERGAVALAKELLPALDNLDRALEAAADDDPLLQGVRLVRSELGAALARVGIESFSPAGEVFDPAVHEAVATAEQGAGGKPSGTVVEVYQAGYRLRDSVIRPARVVVAA